MLFLAAALLSASVHLMGVADAAPVPPSSPVVPVAVSSPVLAETPAVLGRATPVRDEATAVDLGDCRAAEATTFSAESCLDQLAGASSDRVLQFASTLDADGDDVATLTAAVTAQEPATSTASWWQHVSTDRRAELVALLPGLVGNLEGVPYAVRDDANRVFLWGTTAAVAHRLDAGDGEAGDQERLAMLRQVRATLDGMTNDVPSAGAASRHLVSLDTQMPGRAAVAIGDLDTADDVSVLVPGMLFTVSGQLVDWTNTAGALYDEQTAWSALLGRGGVETGSAPSVAVVSWMGYRTPDLTNFYDLGLADRGAAHLEDALSGLDAARAADPPRVSVMAHSYGSTTATIALSSHRVSVDSLVLLGSPGSVVSDAADLSVRGADVYAAAGSFDPVAGSGFFGADPATAAFGAVVLHMGGGDDTVTGRVLASALGHNDYFKAGTESMRSLALIGLGRGDLVDGRDGEPSTDGPELPDITLVRPQDVYLRD